MTNNIRKRSIHLVLSAAAFAVVAISTLAVSAPTYAATFNDIENHWSKSYIETVTTFDAVSGYTDGSFKPDEKIQRIEFIAMIVNALGLEVRPAENGEYWGQPYIEVAIRSGLITSNEYGNMDTSMDLSREEMASIVINAYMNFASLTEPLLLNDASSKLSDFDTVSPSYYESAIASVALDFISGFANGTFAPKQTANRAQAAVVSYKLLVKLGTISNLDLPENIVVLKSTVKQGDLLKITVYHAESPSEITLDQDLYPNFKWYDTGDMIEGYIPTNYSSTPGAHSLKFTNTKTGNTTTKNITVTARDFRVQRMTIDPNVESSTKTEEAYAQYRKYFNPSREISSPVKYYTQPFLLPTRGKLTTEFGESRYVNGSLTTYRHAGIDIAAPRNAEVLSTNTGKVVLAMHLTITGNSIVVDHGEGIFSVYFHLDKLFVKEGDMVERGQLIGAVGSTGFSTGPHLHFTMSYYRFDIEPGFMLYGETITKGNYLNLMK